MVLQQSWSVFTFLSISLQESSDSSLLSIVDSVFFFVDINLSSFFFKLQRKLRLILNYLCTAPACGHKSFGADSRLRNVHLELGVRAFHDGGKSKPEKGLEPSSPERQKGMRTKRQTHAKPCAAETEARRGENKRAGVLSRLPVALAASRPFCKAS